MINLIFRPCDYLSITWSVGATSKKAFDWYLPSIVALVVAAILCTIAVFVPEVKCSPLIVTCTPVDPIFFNGSAFGLLTGFLQTMPGFFVAALAAIATFNNPDMDSRMLGVAPKDRNGDGMTRRRFLSQAFAYLTFLSICLFLVAMSVKFGYEVGLVAVSVPIFNIVYFITVFVLAFFLIQMLLITCLCLYYLGDRIHTP